MDYVDQVFGKGGFLAQEFKGYEPRPQQVGLARAVDKAIRGGKVLVAEAPCGVGKSISYLVPAIRYLHEAVADAEGEEEQARPKVIIATANIALQEQLVGKDLPTLAKVLPWKFTYAILKGRSNYLCRARAEDAGSLLDHEVKDVQAWAKDTETGDVSELSFTPSPAVWSRVCGDAEECDGECDGERCGKEECFYLKARKAALAADVIVCNYHVLFSHMKIVDESGGLAGLLPDYDVLVMDEAHEASDIAGGFFGTRVTLAGVMQLARQFQGVSKPIASALEAQAERFFGAVAAYAESPRYKARLKERGAFDHEPITLTLGRAAAAAEEFSDGVEDDKVKRHVRGLASRANNAVAGIRSACDLEGGAGEAWVHWIENEKGQRRKVALCGRPVDVSEFMRSVATSARASVFLSATMTVGGKFEYVRKNLGLTDARSVGRVVEEFECDSPFDFASHGLLIVPAMENEPNSPGFADEVAARMSEVVEALDGRTLGLFTSYRMLTAVAGRIDVGGRRLLVQGEAPRTQLVEEFRSDLSSVLLGTSSFWTGIDVQGESLSCVCIDRLPFPSPEDPVADYWAENDRGWFKNHSLPESVVTFRQGVGRLIRARDDVGIVVCFDQRLVTKGYGGTFIRSLPPFRRSRDLSQVGSFIAWAKGQRSKVRA